MHQDWEKAVLVQIEEPYAEMDQIVRNLYEKDDVETNSEMHVKNDASKQTIVENLEDAVRDLPTEVPQVRALQVEIDGHKHVCTYPKGNKFKYAVMLLNGNSQEDRLVENPYLDVFRAKSVVVKKALIVLKEGSPVVVNKYDSFHDHANTVKSRLPNLPNRDFLEWFSACKLANGTKVIVSGGANKTGTKSA